MASTPNLGLEIIDLTSTPNKTVQDWKESLDGNMTIIDTAFGNLSPEQITVVNSLPTADATEYEKHLLYCYQNDLYYITFDVTNYTMTGLCGEDSRFYYLEKLPYYNGSATVFNLTYAEYLNIKNSDLCILKFTGYMYANCCFIKTFSSDNNIYLDHIAGGVLHRITIPYRTSGNDAVSINDVTKQFVLAGDGLQASTSGYYPYDEAYHTRTLSVDYTKVQSKLKSFTNVSASTWVSDNTYANYPYKCDITCTGITVNSVVEVIFDMTEAISGDYAPICATSTDTVTIYSKVDTAITIPVIKEV